MKKINVILLVLWMIVIFLFSNEPASESTKVTHEVTKTVVNLVGNVTGHKVNENEMNTIIDQSFILVRKSAHFLEYLILGLLMFNVLKDYYSIDKIVFLLALLLCMIYACSDEFHQLFVFGRSGQMKDVLIDTSGSFLGILLYYFLYNTFQIKKKRKNS